MPSPASDPDDLDSLRRRVAELEAQLHPAKTVATAGGAAVNGNVNAGGHFIGRDFIQTIQQVLAPGDDPAQAEAIVGHYMHAQAMALAGLKLSEIDPTLDRSQRSPLQLADVYVPLNTTHRLPEEIGRAHV